MVEERIFDGTFDAKPGSFKWDCKGWVMARLAIQITEPLINIGRRPQTWSVDRELLEKHAPFFDKHGY
jgi:hypothetical protein